MLVRKLLADNCQSDPLMVAYAAYAISRKGYKVYGSHPLLLSTDAETEYLFDSVTRAAVLKLYADTPIQDRLFTSVERYAAKCEAERLKTATADDYKLEVLRKEMFHDTGVRVCGKDNPDLLLSEVAFTLKQPLKKVKVYSLAPGYYGYFVDSMLDLTNTQRLSMVTPQELKAAIKNQHQYISGIGDNAEEVIELFLPYVVRAEGVGARMSVDERKWMQEHGFINNAWQWTKKAKAMNILVSRVLSELKV